MKHTFSVSRTDDSDPAAVREWAYGFCAQGSAHEKYGDLPHRQLAEAVAKQFFPAETRSAAVQGCLAGLAVRRSRGLEGAAAAPLPLDEADE